MRAHYVQYEHYMNSLTMAMLYDVHIMLILYFYF